MKILVDVNVFIDVVTKRANWQGSLRVLSLTRQSSEIEGWISALTVPLLYFFRLRVTEEQQARVDAQAAVKGFSLVPLTPDIIDKAMASVLPDFEDNIQLISAEIIAADHIVTRNKKRFQPAPLSGLTPEEWLVLDTVANIETHLQA
ncbi:MAG: PIN domain-containing protein [Candidatus Binatia bacterium]